jgi:cytochrome c biogenesis protein
VGHNLYADRYRWGPFGTVIAHVSFVVIMLGFFLSATTGFRDQSFVAPVGQTVDVGHGTGLSIHAKSFTETDYPNGMPKDYAADLVLYKNGTQVQRQVIRVNHPMTWDGVSVYQSSFGIAASMVVADAAGAELVNTSPALFESGDNQHIFGSFTVPGKNLTVFVVEAASGQVDPNIKAGQVQLEIHQAGVQTPVAVQVISQGKPETIDGLTYTFERNRQFTGLIVARDPGVPFVWVGSALFVLGLILVFFFPHRRIWVRATETDGGTEIRCASTIKRDPAFEPQFHQMITEIQRAGDPSGATPEGAENDA